MLRLLVNTGLVVSTLAQDFQHNDCFNVFGEQEGVALSNDGPQRTAMVEGFQYFGNAEIGLAEIDLDHAEAAEDPTDQYPIPETCFKMGKVKREKIEKTSGDAAFDLSKCQEGRTPSDMLLICMTICKKTPTCTGAVYTGYAAGDGACQLYGGENLEWPRCGYYPYRFGCSKRQKDAYLGIFCPEDPLPSYVYKKRKAVVGSAPATKPLVYWIGGQLWIDHSSFTDQTCPPDGPNLAFQASMGQALMKVFKDFGATKFLRIDCQKEQPAAGLAKLLYWLESDTAVADVNQLRNKINSGVCSEPQEPCGLTFWTDSFVPALQTELGVLGISIKTASTDNTNTKAENGVMIGQPYEYHSCVDEAGELAGFQFAPDFVGMVYNDVEFNPEQHAPVQPFYLSMRNPDAWYPIPLGCFNDFDAGSESNPQLAKVGAHYELVDKEKNGKKFDCLGNRTEEEMMRICVEICHSINFNAKDPTAEEQNCVAVNYDEHGGTKGHCHIYSPHDAKLLSGTSQACDQIGGINAGGVCASNRTFNLIDHAICPEWDVNIPPCGRRNFVVVGCHFYSEWCLEMGRGYQGEDRVCDLCPEGKHSYIGKRDPFSFPHPERMSGKMNYCKTCEDGRKCQGGVGCLPHEIESGTCPPKCDKGHFGVGGICTPCVPGSFQQEMGQTACDECAPGSSQLDAGQSACLPCPVGEHQIASGQRTCDQCPEGRYAETSGHSECVACPNTFITKRWGSSSSSDCVCEKGDYYPCEPDKSCSTNLTSKLRLECKACPKGFTCAGSASDGVHVQPMLEEGMYALIEKPYEAYQCMMAVHLCVGGEPDSCGGGSFGLQCANCKDGEHMPKGGDCTPCEEGGSFLFAPVAAIITCIVMLVLYQFTAKKNSRIEKHRSLRLSHSADADDEGDVKKKGSKDDAKDRVKNSAGASGAAGSAATSGMQVAATGAGAAGILTQSLGVVVSNFQLFAVVASFDLDWPQSFKSLTNILMIFLFQIDVLRPSCFVGFSLASRYIPGVILPPCLCLLMLATFAFSRIGAKILPHRIHKMDSAYTLNTLGSCLTGLYIAVCKCIINIFECRTNPSAPQTMKSHDGFDCLDEDIVPLLPLTILLILVFMVGLPAHLCWALKVAPSRYHTVEYFRKRFEFFVSKWNPRWYYWGLVILMRNLFVSLIAVVTPDPLEQLMLVILLFAPVLALTLLSAPWREEGLNWLDMFISSTLVVTMLLAVALLPVLTDRTKNTIGVLMVCAFSIGVMAAMVILLDVMNILFRQASIFSQKPLDPKFQADFVATMLKVEVLRTIGNDVLFRTVSRFFSELPLTDGKRIAMAMDIVDAGLFGGDKPQRGIAPNPPRSGETFQKMQALANETKAKFLNSLSEQGSSDDLSISAPPTSHSSPQSNDPASVIAVLPDPFKTRRTFLI